MKKIIRPAQREEAVYFSDFTGKPFQNYMPDVELKISFGYGSGRDGANLELHLNDDDIVPIINLIKEKLSTDIKEELKNKLNKLQDNFYDSMQSRDWDNCDYFTNSIWFLRELLDIPENIDELDQEEI